MLAGSWNFHQLFDGLHTNEGHLVPSLGIEWVGHADNSTQMDDSETRYMVTLRIQFFSNLAENDLKGSLKTGSSDEGGGKWLTHVYVKKPELFQECIQWKYAYACKTWEDLLNIWIVQTKATITPSVSMTAR